MLLFSFCNSSATEPLSIRIYFFFRWLQRLLNFSPYISQYESSSISLNSQFACKIRFFLIYCYYFIDKKKTEEFHLQILHYKHIVNIYLISKTICCHLWILYYYCYCFKFADKWEKSEKLKCKMRVIFNSDNFSLVQSVWKEKKIESKQTKRIAR